MIRNVTELNFAAALAEEIYRRGVGDQPINILDFRIGGSSAQPFFNTSDISGFARDARVGFEGSGYQYTNNGFCGRIVTVGDTHYVVFRGSDSSESFLENFAKAQASGFDQYAQDNPARLTDIGDWTNNVNLGQGKNIEDGQMMDALRLTEHALSLAAGNKSKVVVVGQSLGGGLVGLVSGILDVKGYAFAPAPYLNSLESYAELASVEDMGLIFSNNTYFDNEIPQSLVTLPGFINSSEDQKKKYFEINGYTISDYDTYFDNAMEFVESYKDNIITNLHRHTLQGEALSDGLGSFFWLAGSYHFSGDPLKTVRYDIGETINQLPDLYSNTPVTLHGMSLHGLVVSTADMGLRSFQEILKTNASLRYGLLENAAISGPVEGNRQDPRDPGFGGSGLNSSGSNTAILFRALWKEIDPNEFYTNFYNKFTIKLGSGAVSSGLNETTLTPNSLHYAFTQLGLQVVRDGISRTGDASDPVFSQAAWNVFGSAADHVMIDIGSINTPQGPNVRPFGAKELDQVFLGHLSAATSSSQASTLLGVTESGISDTSQKLDWEIAVANSLNATNYRPDSLNVDKSHIIFGSNNSDNLQGGSQKDYIYAGSGNDIIISSGGQDIINGGSEFETFDTVSYRTLTVGVNVSLVTAANLISIENLDGSNFDDILQGNSGSNVLLGGKGDDTLKGNGGSDHINGGEGEDTVIFNHSFSDMTFHEYFTGIETAFVFYGVPNSNQHVVVKQAEFFIDSDSTVWSLDDVRDAVQFTDMTTSPLMTYIQSSAPEESAAGTIIGIVDIDLDELPLASNERFKHFVVQSDYLDWSASGNRITFTLKSGVQTDLDNTAILSTPFLGANISFMKQFRDNYTGLWHDYNSAGFSIANPAFRIDDIYDDGLTEIILGPSGFSQSVPDIIFENATIFADSEFYEIRGDIYSGTLSGPGTSLSSMSSIRISANKSDRDDIVTVKLTNDSDGFFRIIKVRNEDVYGYSSTGPTWAVVLAKSGLDEFSAPRTVTVEMTDGTTTVTKDIVIQIGNVNEQPTDIVFDPDPAATTTPSSTLKMKYVPTFIQMAHIIKDLPPLTPLIKIKPIDPDLEKDTFTPSWASPPPINAFGFVGEDLVLTRELTPSEKEVIYDLRVKLTDSGGLSVEKMISIVIDVPDNGIVGTSGNDTFVDDDLAHTYYGLAGTDTVDYVNAPGAVMINIGPKAGVMGWAQGDSFNSVEIIKGSNFGDTFLASGFPNEITRIDGRDGVDTVNFLQSTVGVNVNLATGGGSLLMTSIENLVGTNYNDTLTGTSGTVNILTGYNGNDILGGSADGDTLDGGAGIDTVSYNSFLTGGVTVNLATGLAGLTTGGTKDILIGIENANGTLFDDILIASNVANVLSGGPGNDVYDQVNSGDTVIEMASPPGLPASMFGIDTIRTIASSWTLGTAIENLVGLNTSASFLVGNELDNEVTGNIGNDYLYGQVGNDILRGMSGNDSIYGGDGNDVLEGGSGSDIMDGGNGIDTASYAMSSAGVTVRLRNATYTGGDAQGDTLTGIENISGSAHNDVIDGDASANILSGLAGVDRIAGYGGDDILIGGTSTTTVGAQHNDVVAYRGKWIDYAITAIPDDAYTVNDLRGLSGANSDGNDTVREFEFFDFNGDGLVAASNILNSAPTDIVASAPISILEGFHAAGTTIGTLTWIDPNQFDKVLNWNAQSVHDNSNSGISDLFNITWDSAGVATLKFAKDVTLDFGEWSSLAGDGSDLAGTPYGAEISVTDWGGLSMSKRIAFTVTDDLLI